MKFLTLPPAMIAWLYLRFLWTDALGVSLKARTRIVGLFALLHLLLMVLAGISLLAVALAEAPPPELAGQAAASIGDILLSGYIAICHFVGLLEARRRLVARL